jgi:uncharacterized membrane protein YphA (DoxX/SURF4 family)
MPQRAPAHQAALGLRVLSIALGVFFLFMALDKLPWLGDRGLLTRQLTEWKASAPPPSRWYIDTIALPGSAVFAPLVLGGELAVALALLTGVQVRLAAVAGLFMVVNFHFAMGVMLQYGYLWNAYGPPVLVGLLALVVGGGELPFTVRLRPRASLASP